jgi:flagellar basal-body rod protein FlgB
MLPLSETGTVGLLNVALDATVMRQQAIAHNIANAGVAGYQRLGVTFEQRFTGLQGGVSLPALAASGAFQPSLALLGKPGDSVALDQEMAALSETTLHHQALLKVLNKNLSLLSVAINEGKR